MFNPYQGVFMVCTYVNLYPVVTVYMWLRSQLHIGIAVYSFQTRFKSLPTILVRSQRELSSTRCQNQYDSHSEYNNCLPSSNNNSHTNNSGPNNYYPPNLESIIMINKMQLNTISLCAPDHHYLTHSEQQAPAEL